MIKLGIVGATGLVGQTVLKVLKEQGLLDRFELCLIASKESLSKTIEFNGLQYKVIELNESCLRLGLDVVIFSAGDDVSDCWCEQFVEQGVFVIDNSNAFRRRADVPLIVPEINGELVSKKTKLISNPNCSTIQLAMVVDALRDIVSIDQVVVSTYQSVSGAGKDALKDYQLGTRNFFKKGIRDNIVASIGLEDDTGFCSEERKIMFELKKILNCKIDVVATAVRVPIAFCHGESVYVKTRECFNLSEIISNLKRRGLKVSDDLFYPVDCAGTNDTYVCRIRKCGEWGLALFIIADNLRRGAAFNAVKILEKIIPYFTN